MPGPRSIKLARVFGIPITANITWFVSLFFVIWWISDWGKGVVRPDSGRFPVGVAVALGFAVALVLHELGHALAARRQGIEVHDIQLWLFGGITRRSREADTAAGEFAVAGAGPGVTFLVSAACFGAGALASSPQHMLDIMVLKTHVSATPALAVLSWLALINAFLLLFNLVPALPLDGGQLARALAWRLTGDRNRATRATARLGQAFAYVVIGAGLAAMLIFRGGFFTGFLFLLLGLFLNQAARGALLQSAVAERIKDVRVADIMDREPVTIAGETTLLQAEEEFFLRYRWPWFAVVDADGHYLGVLRSERVEQEIASGRPALAAADVADDEPPWRIGADQSLEALLGSEGLRRLGAVIAVDSDGILRGVVTLAQVRRALTPSTGAW